MRVVVLGSAHPGAFDRFVLTSLVEVSRDVVVAHRPTRSSSRSRVATARDELLRVYRGARRGGAGPLGAVLRAPGHVVARKYVDRVWTGIAAAQEAHFGPRVGVLDLPQVTIEATTAAEQASEVAALSPDVMVQLGWGIVRPPLLKLAPHGVLSWHHGVLPSIRGLYTPFHAVAAGRPDWLGITLQRLVERIDEGVVIERRSLDPSGVRSLIDAHLQLDELGVQMLTRALRRLASGEVISAPGRVEREVGVYRSYPGLRDVLRYIAGRGRFFGR